MTDSNATASFTPVPVRARHDGWTPERQRAFIEHLADTGSVTEAATRVGLTEQSAYRLRRRRDAAAFDAAWEAALERGIQRLTGIAFDRAINGAPRRVYYHGELVAEERVYSDRLLIHLLKQARGGLTRPRERAHVHRDWDAWMDSLESPDDSAPAGGYRLWREGKDEWFTSLPAPDRFRGRQLYWFGHPDYQRELTKEEWKRLSERGSVFEEPKIEWIT